MPVQTGEAAYLTFPDGKFADWTTCGEACETALLAQLSTLAQLDA